jgi:hypothetical protein
MARARKTQPRRYTQRSLFPQVEDRTLSRRAIKYIPLLEQQKALTNRVLRNPESYPASAACKHLQSLYLA